MADPDLTPTRRTILKVLLATGALGGSAALWKTQVDDSGGDMTDQRADLLAEVYAGPLADRPSPGVAGRFYKATDGDGGLYRDTGSRWAKVTLGLGSLTAANLNNTIYTNEVPGDNVAAKVRNAISILKDEQGGRGTVEIAPPNGTQEVVWGEEITIDLVGPGVEVVAPWNLPIYCDVDGTAITVRGGRDAPNDAFRLKGGKWRPAEGATPDCWITVEDTSGAVIEPAEASFDDPEYGGRTTAIRLRNATNWTEMTQIRGGDVSGNPCVDMIPASENPEAADSATESFQGTRFENRSFHTFTDEGICVRMAGNPWYSEFQNPQFFLHGSRSIGLELDTQKQGCEGVSLQTPKFEEHAADTIAVRCSGEYSGFYSPVLFGGYFDDVTTKVQDNTGSGTPGVYHLYRADGALLADRRGAPNRDEPGINHTYLHKSDRLTTQMQSPAFTFDRTVDVTSRPANRSPPGAMMLHDGSGSLPEGPAVSIDGRWVSLVDGSTASQ